MTMIYGGYSIISCKYVKLKQNINSDSKMLTNTSEGNNQAKSMH